MWKLDKETILKSIWILLVANAFLLSVWLMSNEMIFGVDSWYWAKVSGFTVLIVNVTVFAFYLLFASFFFIGSRKTETALVLSITFLSSMFVLRIIEFEFDDYLFMFLAMFFILIFKDRAWIVGIGLVIFYITVHGFYTFDFYNQDVFLEHKVDFTKALYLLPALYLFFVNKKWSYLVVVVVLFAMFPVPKFVTSALSMLILSLLYTMQNQYIKYDWIFLLMFSLSVILGMWLTAEYYVNEYSDSLSLCDEATRVCDNSDVDDWWKGHYLSYNIWKPTNFPSDSYTITYGYDERFIEKSTTS